MRTGALEGFVDKTWQVVHDSGELAAAVTSYTISGLNGDVDQKYRLISRVVNGYNGTCVTTMHPNNDTGANYGYQYVQGADTVVGAGRNSASSLNGNYLASLGAIGLLDFNFNAKSGSVRTGIIKLADSIVGTGVYAATLYGQSWNNTVDNITSFVISCNRASGIGIGSRFILLKEVRIASGLRTGELYIRGTLKGAWQEVYRTTIGNSNLILGGNFEGWAGGASSWPDNWTGGNGTPAREGTIKKLGSYSFKVTRAALNAGATQTRTIVANTSQYTLGCWVYQASGAANRAGITIECVGGNTTTTYHSGASTGWEWLTATVTNTSRTQLKFYMTVDTTAGDGYFDGAVCVLGTTLPDSMDTNSFEQTSITVSGLLGNTLDQVLRVRVRAVNGYNGGAYVYVRINNDSNNNYGHQELNGQSTTIAASRAVQNAWDIGYSAALNQLTHGEMLLYAKAGFLRTAITDRIGAISGTTVNIMQIFGQSYSEGTQATQLTSLVLFASQNLGLGIGTEICVERLNLI